MIEILIVLVCLILSSFFSAMETTFLSLNLLNTVKGNRKRLYNLYLLREKIIITCLIGNNVCVVFATVSLNAFIESFNFAAGAVVLIFSTQIIVFFLLSEIIPKAIARKKYTSILKNGYFIIIFFYYLLYPFSWMLFSILKLLLKNSNGESIGREDVFHFINSNFIEEIPISKTIFKLNQVYTENIHTSINSVHCIEKNKKIVDCIELLNQYPYSRYPVYKNSKDNIIGYVEVGDFLNRSKNTPLDALIKKAIYVPEFLNVDILLIKMQKENIPIVFTVNEYGNILGIVTREDIAEQIVGEVFSYEQKNIQPNIHTISDNQFLIDTLVDIDYFNEYFHTNIEKDMYNTLNGYLLEKTKIFPKKNQIIFTSIGNFKVEKVGEKRIMQVSFQPISKS